MLISLTVGKVDAGVAVLLTEDKRLIEFPSILLPPSISSGSIVDITVARNVESERAEQAAFETLQQDIYTTYGQESPKTPVLRCRNATQTSVVLEWDPIVLATASLRSLSLFRNGAKVGAIPRPLDLSSTKISGLAVDTDYTFHLVLRTSAGTFTSNKLPIRTHKMTDLSGITITPGVLPAPLRYSLAGAVERIGGRLVDTVRIDTTHFVCTEGRGSEWERAVEMNIPVVRPEWVEGCEREGRLVGVRAYYLGADPKTRQIGQSSSTPGPARRTESQASIKRVPPASTDPTASQSSLGRGTPLTAQSDMTDVSPRTGVNGIAAREDGGFERSTGPPPTPPAKDHDRPSGASSTQASPPLASDAQDMDDEYGRHETNKEGSDEGEDAASHHDASEPEDNETRDHDPHDAHVSRGDYPQSPFDSSHKDDSLALRPGPSNEEGRASEGGSFSEVQL